MRIIFLLTIIFSCILHRAEAQTKNDSLLNVVETTSNDSVRIEAFLSLIDKSPNQQQAVDYGLQALVLAEKNNFINMKGIICNKLGILYFQLGNYEKTLDYFYQSSHVYESTGESDALARSYNNIGLILSDLGRLEETIKYHKMSISIKQKLNDEEGIANSYSNLGLAYEALDSLDLAMNYYRKALMIDQKLNNAYGLFTIYSNIGQNHFKRKNYDSTIYYYNKAVMLSDQINNKFNKAKLLIDYAKLNAVMGEYDRAIEKYNSGLRLANEASAASLISNVYHGLSEVYEALKNIDMAFYYYKKYDSINEIIFSEEQTEMLAKVESNHQIQKSQKEIELLRKEAEIKDLRIRNNTFLTYLLVAVIVLIAAIVVLQYRKNNYKSRTNELLIAKNDEIVEKNKNIMDSILYAKNIQKAILPSGQKLKRLFSDAFVYSKARDVVNGDFYWFAEKEDKIVIAAVDCTGHGVPAAFLNVLGNSHLYNIVVEHNILEPAEILRQLNKRILSSLTGNKTGLHSDNGMDVGLCLINKNNLTVTFAGAKRPLYYFNNGELSIIKGDSHPVGGEAYKADRHYKQHVIQLEAKDTLYLFTDGIVDQFGGKHNKKFMYPKLRSLLKRIRHESMGDQLMVIKEELHSWQKNNEQTDDILIIGVRV